MAQSIIVAPSILAARFGDLNKELAAIAGSGADWLHIDIMDGSFVPPITFGTNMVTLAKQNCKLELDVHLMVRNPEAHFSAFKDAGAARLTIHQETCPHLHRSLQEIRRLGMKSGVAINPATPAPAVYDALEFADLVLVMTVNPGWGGQAFIRECVAKIEALSQEIKKRQLPTLIEVDGGINAETAKLCTRAGASVLVAGTSIFGSSDYPAAVKALRG